MNILRKTFLSILLLQFFCFQMGCIEVQKAKNNNDKSIVNSNPTCLDNKGKEKALVSIFMTDYIVKKHMKPEIKNGTESLSILQSDFFTKELQIDYFNNKIQFVDSSNMTEETFRIKVSDKDCENKSFRFVITCPIQGNWYASGESREDSGQWVSEITSGGIAD